MTVDPRIDLAGGEAGDTSATVALADRLSRLTAADLPSEVIDWAKSLVLDVIGCQVAFARLPWSRSAHDYVLDRLPAHGCSTVAVHGTRTCAEDAAFVNAVFGHGFEMDDTEMLTASHPGTVVIPTAVAVGEQCGSSGADVLAAVVAGYDAMLRVLLAGRDMMRRGFHTTAVGGPFGAATAAGRLLGLDAAQLRHTFGIAASRAGGVTEYSVSGGSVKRFHAGFAARSGVEAACLARLGVTGPAAPIEGRRGLLNAVAHDVDIGELLRGLGKEHRLWLTGIKLHSCCAAQHTVLDATAAILAGNRVEPDDVAEIRVIQRAREVGVVGDGGRPDDVVAAQFSAPFGVALRVLRGANGPTEYSEANLSDPQLLAFARKVHYVTARAGELTSGAAPADVTIRLRDGTALHRRVEHARGTPQNPVTAAEVEEKFLAQVSEVLTEPRAREVLARVRNLEHLTDVRELAELLQA